MSSTTYSDRVAVGAVVPEGGPSLPSRASLSAVLAGAVIAIAVGAMLNVLGVAIGATLVDTTARATPDAATMGLSAGIWLAVANLIGLAVGGYVAARLAGTADGTDGALHGLAVWALGVLLSAAILGNVVASATGTVARGVGDVVGTAAQGAGQTVAAAADQVNPQALAERFSTALNTGGDPATMSPEQVTAEIARLTAQRVTQGEWSQAERQRLNALVARSAGVDQAEAARRVDATEAEIRTTLTQAEERARAAADAAAAGAATGAFWLFAAMLLGAVAAVIGARMGTRARVAVEARI
jgi:hypothetical protein